MKFTTCHKCFAIVLLVLCCAGFKNTQAQTEHVTLDTAMIIAQRQGFVVADFIALVKADTSFYQSFKNLHRYAYQVNGNLNVYDKTENVIAGIARKAHQTTGTTHRVMVIDEDKFSGSILDKKGNYNYYTAQLFNDIFFENTPVKLIESKTAGKRNKHIEQLKTLLFSPGTSVKGVPLVGNKLQVFDTQQKYYDYFLNTAKYNDSLVCYVFTCTAKTNATGQSNGNAIIKNLVTYFDKKTFQVIARKYEMQYASVAFDFDVTMDIKISPVNGVFVPTYISYMGNWDVAFKKEEKADFQLKFFNWIIRP
ncbi:MAG: hypothetical protein JNK61_04270 [Bacteroidia bacterium]|nr:hypothetical protein [Bacteroidia bacterium]